MMSIRKYWALALVASLLFVSCVKKEVGEINIIPRPAKVELREGWARPIMRGDECWVNFHEVLTAEQRSSLRAIITKGLTRDGLTPIIVEKSFEEADLVIRLDDAFPAQVVSGIDGYNLHSSEYNHNLCGNSINGIKAGLQTLLQLVDEDGDVPSVRIQDSARFAYRGVMLDVSRHFVEKEYILKLLDEMARYKLNRFHWHLVDGGGWRLEIERYPKLIEKACYRSKEDWTEFWHKKDRRFVTKDFAGAYGGYYSKDDVREVVAYAETLGITIIPEIELPGHSNEVFFAYPELACTVPYNMEFEAISDLCIGKELTFEFYQNVLDEVMELFPSEYIHIGGDEANMNTWEHCLDCKERMHKEKLKDTHELQSYMIKRIERYLKSKGRKLIGWDEILMGGLAPDATVMSWRGESGGIKAAEAGHDVVMTPNSHLYLDYYQTYGTQQPRAIGGFVTLQKVYSYDPVPKQLSQDKAHHVMGVQANLWTEYVKTSDDVSRMLFPRLLALSEVAWTPLEKRDYKNFRQRATSHTNALRERGIKAYELTGIDTDIKLDTVKQELSLSLEAERSPVEIRYTTDGTEPSLESPVYSQPLKTQDSLLIKARPFGEGISDDVECLEYRADFHKGIGKKIGFVNPWNERYPASGINTLIDGERGTPTYLDGKWQGFTQDLDVTINLGKEEELHHIFAKFMQEREQWVYMPKTVEVLISKNGVEFTSIGVKEAQTDENNPRPCFEIFDFYTKEKARYIRLKATIGRSAGHFIFTDEVVIY